MLAPKRKNNKITCFDIKKDKDYVLDNIDLIKETFEYNKGFSYVYINSDYSQKYKAIIYEGNFKESQSPYKKVHFYPYEEEIFRIGQYISYYDSYGKEIVTLLDSLDTHDKEAILGHLYKCNNWVKYIYDGVLYQYPCYFPTSTQRTDFYYNNSVNIVDGRDEVWLQKNEITSNIKPNDRFLFDGVSYKVTYVQNHNNVSLENNVGGIIILKMIVSEAQDIDDKENNIAMSNPLKENKEPTIKEEFENNVVIEISPNITKILRGETQEYACVKYVNGIATNEILSIVDNSTMRSGYYDIEIGNNTFTIHNIKKHTVKKVEIQVKDSLGNTKDLSITLGGDM